MYLFASDLPCVVLDFSILSGFIRSLNERSDVTAIESFAKLELKAFSDLLCEGHSRFSKSVPFVPSLIHAERLFCKTSSLSTYSPKVPQSELNTLAIITPVRLQMDNHGAHLVGDVTYALTEQEKQRLFTLELYRDFEINPISWVDNHLLVECQNETILGCLSKLPNLYNSEGKDLHSLLQDNIPYLKWITHSQMCLHEFENLAANALWLWGHSPVSHEYDVVFGDNLVTNFTLDNIEQGLLSKFKQGIFFDEKLYSACISHDTLAVRSRLMILEERLFSKLSGFNGKVIFHLGDKNITRDGGFWCTVNRFRRRQSWIGFFNVPK